MSSYIGKVQVESGDQILIGSTLYGTCSSAVDSAAKIVTLASFDALINGVTVHVKFVNGNSVLDNITLAVGSTLAQPVTGNCICNANEIIAFTFEESGANKYWRANHSIKIEQANNIITKISGQTVNAATKDYVDSKTQGLDGLTSAMHFRGISSTAITDGGTQNPTIQGSAIVNKEAGDVVLYDNQEFVWDGTAWELLGDEGSYALKSHYTSIGSASNWSAGSAPTLGTDIDADDITEWSSGSASSAVVENGVLRITNSVVPTLTYSAKTIPNVTSVGSAPTLTVTPTDVVIP